MNIALTLNGHPLSADVDPRQHLADFLRAQGLTGTHLGCEHGVCGACTVLLNGRIVRGCLTLAVQADGATVETVEGASDSGRLAALQDAFHRRNALQCGFCTAGMLLTAADYLEQGGTADRAAIRHALSGNYCRCTGYQSIVDAVADVASGATR
jgi:carbon-monoxide dehydrogenase small subunit